MSDKEITIVMPHGALGTHDSLMDLLEAGMRVIAGSVSEDDIGDWAEKYGVNFENDVFMMHRFCWCDQGECEWCAGCTCPSESFHYFVDDKEVTYDGWAKFFLDEVGDLLTGEQYSSEEHEAWQVRAEKANKRRLERHDPVCDFCLGHGIFDKPYCEMEKGAANFYFKPSNFCVQWYKFIGRDMTVNKKISASGIAKLIHDCLESLNPRKALSDTDHS
jgi:hypothetical protein